MSYYKTLKFSISMKEKSKFPTISNQYSIFVMAIKGISGLCIQ